MFELGSLRGVPEKQEMPMIRTVVLTAAAAAILLTRSADAEDCHISGKSSVVEYWSGPPALGLLDPRCDLSLEFPISQSCHLYGWLIKPASSTASSGVFPTIVYIHGSGDTQKKAQICEIANYFTERGYLFWAPYMRGVDDNSSGGPLAGFHNTGMYIEDWVDAQTTGNNGENTLAYMQQEVVDIRAAFFKLLTLRSNDNSMPLVNLSKVAVMGHSYGGALTVLTAAQLMIPMARAAIDLSGAVLSWGDGPAWSDTLGEAVENRVMPIYFLQTTTESPTGTYDSTVELFAKADADAFTRGPAAMAIYSAPFLPLDFLAACFARGDGYPKCVHSFFHRDHDQVMRWIPGVRRFLKEQGME
jgi:pimeloyl-ACP methyl ester carboxylesterase